jgi:hypothetical protein
MSTAITKTLAPNARITNLNDLAQRMAKIARLMCDLIYLYILAALENTIELMTEIDESFSGSHAKSLNV